MADIGKHKRPLLGVLDTMERLAADTKQFGKAYAFHVAADIIAASNTFEEATKRINILKRYARPEPTRREEFKAYATITRILSYMH